jgi:hypothetical protein
MIGGGSGGVVMAEGTIELVTESSQKPVLTKV